MDTADLFTLVADRSLPDAAAQFVAAGVPVFPCVPGGKRPLTEHGFHDATTEVRQVAGWWRRWPDANIGVPTGAASGLEVVDVDVKASGSGFAGFNRAHRADLASGWEVLVRTPSGGMHAYYPARRDRHQPSWQAANTHVDFRGDGGYIIVPPSVVEVTTELHAPYALITCSNSPGSPVDAPALREFLDPRPNPSLLQNQGRIKAAVAVAADTERLAAWVTARGEGERNRGLFWASCRLSEAGMTLPEMHDALGPAAEHAGLSPREIMATIRSAYRTTHVAPGGGSGRDEIPRHRARINSQVLS